MPRPHSRLNIRWAVLSTLLILLLGATGCTSLTDFENSQVIDHVPLGFSDPDNHLGQTFIIRRTPLTAVKLHLRLADEAQDMQARLLFHLYQDPNKQELLYSGQVGYQQIRENYPIVIAFPALPIAAGDSLYLDLEATGSPVWAYGRAEDNYPYGQFFLAGQPQKGDLAFSLSYQYGLAAVGQDLQRMLDNAWLMVPLLGLLFLPGFVAIQFFPPNEKYRLPEKLALALGISLALPAVIFTWSSQVGLRFSAWLVIAIYGLLGFATAVLVLRNYLPHRKISSTPTIPDQNKFQTRLPMLIAGLLLIAFLLVLFVRMAMVRDLSGPAWVDPVHHTLISRLIQEMGRIPADFAPYAQASATNYHTGFHVSGAIFTWLTGLEAIDSMFILGQVLNAATLFSVYLLGYELTGSRLAGLLAALLTGFASPMPAYYTSWGRFTQLAGLTILPAGFVLLRQIYQKQSSMNREAAAVKLRINWPLILITAATCSGLFFVHYRVAVFLACLVAADLFVLFVTTRISPTTQNQFNGSAFAATLLFTILLALPVLIPVVVDLLPRRAEQWNVGGAIEQFSIPWSLLTAGLGLQLLFLAGISLLAALFLRTQLFLTLIIWVLLMFLAANLNRLGLPTGGLISNDSVVISLFIPLTILSGFFIAAAWNGVSRIGLPARLAAGLVILLLFLSIMYLGSQKLLTIINPVTVFLRAGDRSAAVWINANLPTRAEFLINPAPWGYGIYVGSDGGYWLSPLTGRLTFPPTLLYGHGNRADIRVINEESAQILENATDPRFLADFMSRKGIGYLYLGVRGGPISAQSLLQSPDFELLYHQEGAWIFRLTSVISP